MRPGLNGIRVLRILSWSLDQLTTLNDLLRKCCGKPKFIWGLKDRIEIDLEFSVIILKVGADIVLGSVIAANVVLIIPFLSIATAMDSTGGVIFADARTENGNWWRRKASFFSGNF